MLALERAEHPLPSLLDALGLAERLHAELEVARIMSESPSLSASRPFLETEADVETRRRVHDETNRWLSVSLSEVARLPRVVVAQGDFVDQAALCCEGRGVRLIVVSSEVQQAGAAVASLARAAQIPVLASRGLHHDKPILAATDLQDPDVPVLWQAARLAAQLRAPLITFHNVDPRLSRRDAAVIRGAATTVAASARARRTRLLEVGQLLPVASTPVVRTEADPAHAILSEARARDVGLIVIGTRYQSWIERLFGYSVAGDVTGRSDRPVLVTPIGASRSIAA